MKRAILAFTYTALKHAWSTRAILWLLVGVSIPALLLPLTLRADGTEHGAQTMILTYTPVAIFAIVLTGTIWMAAFTFAAERMQLQFAMLRTKPVQGASIWLGKWLAILAITCTSLVWAMLLCVLALIIRFDATTIVTAPTWTAFAPDETEIMEQARQQRESMLQQPDAEHAHSLPSLQQLANRIRQRQYRVLPGNQVSWQIPIAPTSATQPLWEIQYHWRLDPMRRAPVQGDWMITVPTQTEPLATHSVAGLIDGNHVIRLSDLDIPPSAPYVTLTFASAPENEPQIFFDNKNPVSLNRQTGLLLGNLLRATILLFALCAAAAALALTVSVFLSFPTTVFATHGILLALVITAIAGRDTPTIRDTHGHDHGSPDTWLVNATESFLDMLYRATRNLREALPFRELPENLQVTLHDHLPTLLILLFGIPLLCALLAHIKVMQEEIP